MKTILIGLIKNYKPVSIDFQTLTFELDVFGEKQEIKVRWRRANPDKWKFSLAEPDREGVCLSNISCETITYNPNNENMRTCYSVTIDKFTYNVPLTLEESNYLDLLVTQLFQSIQNDKLTIIKSVIENEEQKKTQTNEQVS